MKTRKIAILLMILLFGILSLPLTAPAVVDWTKYGSNPVLPRGGTGAWDDDEIERPCVIKDGSTYKMWYGGGDNTPIWQIGYATSSNGTTWNKSGSNPVLTPGASGKFDEEHVGLPWVILDGVTYKMWYTGTDDPLGEDNIQIGYATSPDGIAWTRQNSGDPVLLNGGDNDWDGDAVQAASVIKDGATYKMWYVGWNESAQILGIGYAVSTDGIAWTKHNDSNTTSNPYVASDPVITLGQEGVWNSEWMNSPCVIKEDGLYRMWFLGESNEGKERIGYAYSMDGIHWRQYDGNPIIMEGGSGAFDESDAADPMVLKDGTTYKMWYRGDSGSDVTSFGYATSSAYQGNTPAINQMGVASLNMPSGMNIMLYVNPEGPGPLDINELKVDGPSGFTYTFFDLDIWNVMGNQFPLVVLPTDPFEPDPGLYTFTVKANNNQTASNSVTLGGSTISVPEDGPDHLDRSVNDGTWNTADQVYINPTSTPQFRWKPYLGDDKYYRVLIMDWRKRAMWYSPDPALGSTKSGDGYMYCQIPFETLKYNTPYYWLVEVMDTNNRWSAHNRSRSSWRQIYTGTQDTEAPYDFLMGVGFRSSRSFRDGDQAQMFAVVHSLAPWDIDTTTFNHELGVYDSTGLFYKFDLENDAFTTDPVPFMYHANKSGAPVNDTYTFKVYEDGTSNNETANIVFTIDNSVPQVTKDDMRHENVVTRVDNAYLPYADPELFWKSKGPDLWHRISIMDWQYRRFVWQSDWLNGVAAGNDMSVQVPAGTLKPNNPYRWWVEVYDSAKQNRTRSQWLSFMTGPAQQPGRFLPAIYLLLLLGD